jgi:aminoglycoside phosphotransferase (APT) family kinase protein
MKKHNLLQSDILEKCLKDSLPHDATRVSVDDIQRLSKQGTTTQMYSFPVTYFSEGSEHREEFILRLYKEGSEKNGQKEIMLLKTLKRHGLPVPTAYCFEENSRIMQKPFMIMEKISGISASNHLDTETRSKVIVDKMAKNLVKIHKLDLNYIENPEALRRQFESRIRELLEIKFFIKKYCMNFLGFCPILQRKFIAAVKRLEHSKPRKSRYSLLHLDYEPDHIIVSDGQLIVVDWGEASIGDPAFDVAWAYHKLRLGRETSKIDLGDHFTRSYERYLGRSLVNLQFYKDMVAIEVALRFGLSPFKGRKLQDYAKIVDLNFGNIIGTLLSARQMSRLRNMLEHHHNEIWKNLEYIQDYAIRYLETDRYN